MWIWQITRHPIRPQLGETDTLSNDIMHVDVPKVARDLEQRFGQKAWLSGPFGTAIFPPERDMS
jgi:hypothetical protein